jgi:hypothetical protein
VALKAKDIPVTKEYLLEVNGCIMILRSKCFKSDDIYCSTLHML